jgi:oxaloacetate decarboxylase alpha subunit/pyruvate carboxylase subunit B
VIQIFADKLNIETGVNLEAVVKINEELKSIRKELSNDLKISNTELRDFNILNDKLPANISKLFDLAIEQAKKLSATRHISSAKKTEEELLNTTKKIEKYFGFPEADELVKRAEIPGGMYTNMLAQLKQLKLDHLLPKVLELVPLVRVDAGCPPLVTPTSQIVGVQAVNCVIDQNKGLPLYTNKSIQFVNLVKGSYGKTPVAVNPDFRKKITGSSKEIPYDTKNYKKQENPVYYEYGNVNLAQNEKEELLLELFPSVASEFLLKRIRERHKAELKKIEEERKKRLKKEKEEYDRLTPEQKEARMLDALNNYLWSYEGD